MRLKSISRELSVGGFFSCFLLRPSRHNLITTESITSGYHVNLQESSTVSHVYDSSYPPTLEDPFLWEEGLRNLRNLVS